MGLLYLFLVEGLAGWRSGLVVESGGAIGSLVGFDSWA